MVDAEIAVAYILGFFEFWLVYTATTLKDTNKEGISLPINRYLKIILYGLAAFTAFISIQYAVSLVLNATLAELVTRNIEILYWGVLWAGIIALILLVIGITYNWLVEMYGLFGNMFKGRKWQR